MKLVFIFLLMFDVCAGMAQQSYVVMIQSDNNQQFYARSGQRKMSSSVSGHLIIPQLKDSNYVVIIGFPGNTGHEQKFNVKVNGKDQGFQLKRGADSSWVLYNWQTSELKKGELMIDTPAVRKETGQKGMRNGDSFSRLMAYVVNDTTGMYASYLVERPSRMLKAEPQKKLQKADTVSLAANVQEKHLITTDTKIVRADSNTVAAVKEKTTLKKPSDKIDSSYATVKPDSTIVSIKSKKEVKKPSKGITIPLDSTSIARKGKYEISAPKKSAGNKEDSSTKQKSSGNITSNPAAEIKMTVYEPLHTNPQVKPTETSASQVISKVSEDKYADVRVIEYIIRGRRAGAKNDTVKLMIPVEQDSVTALAKLTPVKDTRDTATRLAEKVQPQKIQPDTLSKRKIVAERLVADTTAKTPLYRPAQENRRIVTNSDCRNMASEYDVDKLRVKMLAADGIEDMLLAARKLAKGKCFTAKQLRALSEVFPSDEGKYRLFDQFYGNVSDADNFGKLISLLSDQYYIRRFQAMLRN